MEPRVLIVAPYYLPIMNGVSLYVYRLASGLQERGFQVGINTISPKLEDGITGDLEISGLKINHYHPQWDNRELSQPISFSYISETLSESKNYDIIHVHDFPKVINDAFIIVLKKILRSQKPVVLTPHGSGYVGPSASKLASLYWSLGIPYKTLEAVDCIITGTRTQFENFKQRYNHNKIALIPTAMLTDEYYKPAESILESDSFNILFIGRIIKEKGIHILLEAIHKAFPTSKKKIRLVCLGPDYGLQKELEEQASHLGISHILSFTGKVTEAEKIRMISWCDVLVLPSFYEAFGIPIIEAMAQGKPVIASATEGAKAIIDHGHNGLLFDIGNSDKLADFLCLLVDDVNLRLEFGINGYRTAQSYRVESLIDEHVKLYQRMFRAGNPS